MESAASRMPVRRNRRSGVEDLWFKKEKVRKIDPESGKETWEKVPNKRHGRGKRWRANYVDDSGDQKTRAFDTKQEAQKWLDGIMSTLVQGTYVDPKVASMTVGKWCDQWIEGYSVHRSGTVRSAKTHIAKIKESFDTKPLNEVRPSAVKAWLADLKKQGLADSYVYALHSRLSQILGDAVYDGVLARNPCSRKTAPPMGKPKCYVATTEQIWGLYEAVPRSIKSAILLGAFAGLRVAEVSGALRTDMDFIKRVFNPARQWEDEPLKTETSATPVPVSEEFVMLLSTTILPGEHTHLVVNDHGEPVPPWQIERAIRDARESGLVDLPETFTFHDLRHYNASWLIASGADIKTVQARVRHASAKTTLDVYGHLWPDADESSRTAMSAILSERIDTAYGTAYPMHTGAAK
ncbi:integrase family protein [Segniliparus rotundus DSM 44985]|uniref:Integrase family protein n=2 Tax=Segniliparus rotundus TaxID=286802 RepID=D6ZE10_SEGRD|nr:integrase family protein [Segniliparus rotundus DSM 44985]